MTEPTPQITPSIVENASTPNAMNWLRQKKVAAGLVFGAAALSLAGCASAEAVHPPEHSHSASATATPEKKQPQYQAAPTEAQLSALYMPSSATDEQLAQNFIKITNLMWSGANQGMVTLKEDNSTPDKQLASEWVTPIVDDSNLFANGVNTANYDQWLNISENNYSTYDGSSRVLETADYKTFETVSDSAQERILNITFAYNIDTSRNLSANGAQNDQEGMWQVIYTPSADGSHWVVAKMADASYMLQK